MILYQVNLPFFWLKANTGLLEMWSVLKISRQFYTLCHRIDQGPGFTKPFTDVATVVDWQRPGPN